MAGNEHTIAQKMTESESSSFVETFKKYSSQLGRFIRQQVGMTEDAEDILQDVWYQYSVLANPDEINSVSGWLYRVARNKITDRFRKHKNVLLDDLVYEGEEGEITIKDILLADSQDDVGITFFKEEFWDTLKEALNELPENQRLVFILNEIEDMTLQEIADQEGVPIKTIISRKGYAVKHLRKRMEYLKQDLN